MTTPKEEGLKPCEHCGKQPVRFGLADAYRCEPCMKNSGWMSKKDWNHRPATEEQGLREALEDMIETGWEYYCNYSVSPAGCDKKIARGFYQAIARAMNAALSHAPAPESERHTQ